mmetsp:Transcript_45624/g.51700  ORF Transcript_45624/g.51700 Transcript_45624/m.51700 type:complete len:215 (-) Transcript_45624:285-929(-)
MSGSCQNFALVEAMTNFFALGKRRGAILTMVVSRLFPCWTSSFMGRYTLMDIGNPPPAVSAPNKVMAPSKVADRISSLPFRAAMTSPSRTPAAYAAPSTSQSTQYTPPDSISSSVIPKGVVSKSNNKERIKTVFSSSNASFNCSYSSCRAAVVPNSSSTTAARGVVVAGCCSAPALSSSVLLPLLLSLVMNTTPRPVTEFDAVIVLNLVVVPNG